MNQTGTLVIVNAYSPSFNVRDVLLRLAQTMGVRTDNTSRMSLLDLSECIATSMGGRRRNAALELTEQKPFNKMHFLRQKGARAFIVIHNIDAVRTHAAMEALSIIASAANIHIIASVDHHNAMFLWHQLLLHRFNWLWFDCTTFLNYATETAERATTVAGTTGNEGRGLSFVLSSLTQNHRDVLRILAMHRQNNPDSQGLDFHRFFTECNDAMLVSSDVSLRKLLNELATHQIISSKSLQGVTVYYVALPESVIRKEILNLG